MEFMPRSFASTAVTNHGPMLIGVGLAVVLAAQLFVGIPIAAAMALIAWGSMLTLRERHMNEVVLVLNFAMYAGIVALGIAAQLNLRYDSVTLCDSVLALAILHKAATAGGAKRYSGG
jgi:hypothetical protein